MTTHLFNIRNLFIIFLIFIIILFISICCYNYKYVNPNKSNMYYIDRNVHGIVINVNSIEEGVIKNSFYLTEFVNCMNNLSATTFSNEDLNNKIMNLNKTFRDDDHNISFDYEDLHTGFELSYNKNQSIYAASVPKAPTAIYAFELIRQNKINSGDSLIFTPEFYVGSSGLIKHQEFYTKYTINELLSYAILHSDNIAFAMLKNYLTTSKIKDYWNKLGVSSLFNNSNLFGELNANDGNIYMKELYKNYLQNDYISKRMIELFINANHHFIAGSNNDVKIAHKYGQYDIYAHDSALVLETHPYVLTILTTHGKDNYENIIKNISLQINDIHNEYWIQLKTNCISLID